MNRPLRIGILGAAHIAQVALIRPSRMLPQVDVVAVAGRKPERARCFARRHGIPIVYTSYAELIDDPDIDAVYIPLPNSLHAPWAIRAMQSGKHVLCEKPLASNSVEAEQMAQVATSTGRLLVEAFHYRYHPLAARMKAIVESGELGLVRHIRVEFSVPLLRPHSIQFRYDLAGGATMDVGCYTINLLRFLAGAEPAVTCARARLIRPQVDRLMEADFRFEDGRTGSIVCALLSGRLFRATATVYGTEGDLHVILPFLPHRFHRVRVRRGEVVRHEHLDGRSTYFYQLQAFAEAIRTQKLPTTSADDAIANMQIVDAVYRAAGLRPRGDLA